MAENSQTPSTTPRAAPSGGGLERVYPWEAACLAGILAVWLAARLPWFGHLLSWDEAMNLLTCQADFLRQQNPFSSWRLRYPPFHDGLLFLLAPDREGFALRAEALSLGFSALALVFTWVINRMAFGRQAALWAAGALALMPAAVFFDRWIKQDVPLAAVGALALACVAARRYWAAGVLMGFAFLVKHMAGYYVAAIGLMLLPLFPRKEFWLAALALALGALAVGGWWYLGQLGDFAWFMSFAVGGMNSKDWVKPMTYYLVQAPVDLGWGGVALGLLGIGVTAARAIGRWRARDPHALGRVIWPLALLAPALTAMHLSYGKTPWYTIVLYPAAATLVGLGAQTLASAAGAVFARVRPRLRVLGLAGGMAALGVNGWVSLHGVSYDAFFGAKDRRLMMANRHSREAGELVARELRPGEPYAATGMGFWNLPEAHWCGVFVHYAGRIPSLMLPLGLSGAEFVRQCEAAGITFGFASMEPGPGKEAFIADILRERPGSRVLPTPAGVVARLEKPPAAIEEAPAAPEKAPWEGPEAPVPEGRQE